MRWILLLVAIGMMICGIYLDAIMSNQNVGAFIFIIMGMGGVLWFSTGERDVEGGAT